MKIKNNFKRLVAVACLAATTAGIAGAASWRENILVDVNKVTVVSNQKTIQEPTLLWNDKTYIPLRATLEAAGCQVDWDQSTYTATVSNRYAALADAMWKSYQFSSILFDYTRYVEFLHQINMDSLYPGGVDANYASSVINSASNTAFNHSSYIQFGIATEAVYLDENGWSSLLPDLQAIHREMMDISSQFSQLVNKMRNYAYTSSSEKKDIVNLCTDLQMQMGTAQAMISNYFDKLSDQMVYNPPIYQGGN